MKVGLHPLEEFSRFREKEKKEEASEELQR